MNTLQMTFIDLSSNKIAGKDVQIYFSKMEVFGETQD